MIASCRYQVVAVLCVQCANACFYIHLERTEMQAGLALLAIIAAYILHQRLSPFVAMSALSSNLGLSAANVSSRLQELQQKAQVAAIITEASPAPGSSSIRQRRSTVGRTLRRLSSTLFQPMPAPDVSEQLVQTGAGTSDPRRPPDTCSPASARAAAGCLPMLHTDLIRRLWTRAQLRVQTLVFTGVVDYNHLESSFLLSSFLILVLGMVFSSRGFADGSAALRILTTVTIVLIVTAVVSFLTLLAFELYRSFRLSTLHALARQLEAAKIEQTLVLTRRRMDESELNGVSGLGGDSGNSNPGLGSRRRSSVAERIAAIRKQGLRNAGAVDK
jgi:hypothetical protein